MIETHGVGETEFRAASGHDAQDGAEPSTFVELTDSVSCALATLGEAVVSVVVEHRDDGAVAAEDRALAERLLQPGDLTDCIGAFALAVSEAETPGAGHLATVSCAVAAFDLIDALDVDGERGTVRGPWPVWRVMSYAAGIALAELPLAVQVNGGNRLRVAVASLATRLASRADPVTASRLMAVVQHWPMPINDRPIADDDTMARLESLLEREWRGMQRVEDRRARRERAEAEAVRDAQTPTAPVRERLDLDLDPLIACGLVDAGTQVAVEQVGPPTDGAWRIGLSLRTEVAEPYLVLRQRWLEHLAAAREGGEVMTVGPDLELAYASLLMATHLPYSLEDFVADSGNKAPAPPHLADVRCYVIDPHHRGAVPFGMLEHVIDDHDVELRATIAHVGVPTDSDLCFEIHERSPFVSEQRTPLTLRIIAFRRAWRDGAFDKVQRARFNKLLRELRSSGRDDIASALHDELQAYDAGGAGHPSDCALLVEGLRSSAVELEHRLKAAVDVRDLPTVRQLAAHLWQTRAFLVEPPR